MPRGHLRQRSPGSWTIDLYVGIDPRTGKKRYHTETVRGPKANAQRRLNELVYQLDTGTFTRPSRETVAEFLRGWLRDYAETNVSERTLEGYQGNVDRYLVPTIGSVMLTKLTPRHVQTMDSGLLRRGLSATTVKAAHGTLSQALRWGERLGILRRNVAGDVNRPRTQHYQARFMDWDECQRYLDIAKRSQYFPAILLAITTGIRRSELVGLRWTDVDFATATLTVPRGLVELAKGRLVTNDHTKGGRRRMMALPSTALGAFQWLREQREAYIMKRGWEWNEDGYIFCEPSGEPIPPHRITDASASIAKRAGLKGVRLHDLRHSHASLMLWAGSSLKEISERLGHAGIAITGDLYAHILPALEREGMARWEEKFGSKMTVDWQEIGKALEDRPGKG